MKKSQLKQIIKECLKEIIIHSEPDYMRDPSNNPFNEASFAKGYRATADSFRTLAGNGETNEGILEDVHAAVAGKDKEALKSAIERFEGQIKIATNHWQQFKGHLQAKV